MKARAYQGSPRQAARPTRKTMAAALSTSSTTRTSQPTTIKNPLVQQVVQMVRRPMMAKPRPPPTTQAVANSPPLTFCWKNPSVTRNKAVATTAIVIVYGFGCDQWVDTLQERFDQHVEKARRDPTVSGVCVLCDRNRKRVMGDIMKSLAGQALGNTGFVKHVRGVVQQHLDRNEQVQLLGHSYGGSIVSRVVRSMPRDSRVHARTYGSIYTPEPDHELHPPLQHFMRYHDIAYACHRKNRKRCKYITWHPPESIWQGPFVQHSDYDTLML